MVHIERISLRGFKSFGNQRVGIPISKGFTAIVGPNGSGKSNVVDGICFVLGRMSTKSMRAERFSDLIWVGNEKYPPGSYAEVSLHLDNSDRKLPVDEPKVVISRRVDRSGRSVYRANKKRMTRNEIVDLLAMAGIFPEGYNIVLQGDITKLVKMTPVERRMLIDELSGIAEYDLKKEKAMRELSKAEENIRATNLVIDEVLSQLRRLERERDEAVRYQDLISQIRELRWQFQHNQLRRHRERYNAILEMTEKGTRRIAELDREIQRLNAEVERKRDRQEEMERTIEKRQEIDQDRLGKQIEEIRAQIVRAQENLKNAEENLEKQRQAKLRLEEDILSATEKIRENSNRVQALTGQRESMEATLADLRSQQTALEKKISALERRNADLRGELSEVEEGISRARAADAAARKKSSQRSLEATKAAEERAYLIRSADDDRKRLESLKAERKQVEIEASRAEEELRKVVEEAERLRGELDESLRSLSQVEDDLAEKTSEKARMEALLRAARESDNPVRKAISALLERRDTGSLEGILGTVSELAKAPEELRVSLNAATGSFSDHIVVKDRDAATRCIRILKDEKIGWANFIPLKDLERLNSKPDASLLKHQGVVGLAVDLITFDEKLRPVYDFLLGRTIVTKDLAASGSLPRRFRAVTLEGDVMDPSGILSGGHLDPLAPTAGPMLSFTQGDLAAIKEEVDSLESERTALSRRIEELRSALLDREKWRGELQARIKSKGERLETLRSEIGDLEERIAQESSVIAEAEIKLKEKESAAESARIEAQEAGEHLAQLEKRRDDLIRRIESPEMKGLEKQFREISATINQKINMDSQIRSDVLALQREVEYLTRSKEKTEEDLKNAEQGIKGLEVVIEKIKRDVPQLEGELRDLLASETEIRDEIKQLRSTIFAEKHDLSELIQQRDALIQDKNRLSVEINSSVYERSQLDQEIHDLEHKLSLMDYEYEPIELDDLEELSRRITALAVEKAKLEPVNMRAIEAYEETEEKFNEYKERRDKVMEEREAILQFMAEIETKKKQVFMEAFENIASNFESIFSKLSPGGTGKLLLENHEDPFSGGLEIEAKPAGKEVTVIDSMSGGEKALTALAFIFAVQAYKPSPFYILDEIDAHLDDDNVKRVAELVAETSKGSQFIVVTLRDSMMAQADELIGVSMEDTGVSKVVGVRMEAGKLVEGSRAEAEVGGAQA